MTTAVKAIYEHGVFRPVTPVIFVDTSFFAALLLPKDANRLSTVRNVILKYKLGGTQ